MKKFGDDRFSAGISILSVSSVNSLAIRRNDGVCSRSCLSMLPEPDQYRTILKRLFCKDVPFDLVFEIEDTGFTIQFYPEVQFPCGSGR